MTGIVVGVDASDGAANALGWAVREANFRETEVTAVLPWDDHDLTCAADAESALDAIVRKTLDPALRWAVAEAQLRDAALVAVHAYPSLGPGGPFSAARMDPLALHRAARRAVEASISGIDTAGVDVVPTVVRGSAAGAIVGASDDADLVVVGSRGLRTWDRLMLGSVASQVALHARVAVAVVPAAIANDTDLPDTSSARSSS